MKISDVGISKIKAADLYKAAGKEKTGVSSGIEGLRPDEVHISQQAVEMTAAVEKAMQAEGVDKDNVAAIREQVHSGAYKITPEELSKSILEHLFYFGEPSAEE